MLLEFKVKNYKCFLEETLFSMIPAPKQKGLAYSLMSNKIKGKSYKALCSSVIYGPNASGKTNIFGAMEVLKSIIISGNIKNNDQIKTTYNAALNDLSLIPNNKLDKFLPVEFSIRFIEDNYLISYELSLDLGMFLEKNHKHRILKERLCVNEKEIFYRTDKITIDNINTIKDYVMSISMINNQYTMKLLNTNLRTDELFLTNGFKNIISASFTELIYNWFNNKFCVVYRSDKSNISSFIDTEQTGAIIINQTIDRAAKLFGLNSNQIGFIKKSDDQSIKLCSLIDGGYSNDKTTILAENYESYGTIRFINMFPYLVDTIQNGGTLVMDEFDASIHPVALMNIINIFHNDDININHAQLIFNTHNPLFLNSNIFRRDEIKFVERDDITDFSTLYSLSDFKTSGTQGVRINDDYMKDYFIEKYGAIKNIDFTELFKEIIREGKINRDREQKIKE